MLKINFADSWVERHTDGDGMIAPNAVRVEMQNLVWTINELESKLAAAEVRIAELDALLGFVGAAGVRIESGNRWLVLRDGVYTVRKVAGVEIVVVHEGDNLAAALRALGGEE